ncbi:MAG: hypothetical protein ACYDC1_01205 [Limisphaerales bacterium]
MSFPTGLKEAGEYVAFFLENDGYNVLASEPFSVVTSTSTLARLLASSPSDGATGLSPEVEYTASITNGTTRVVTSSVTLKLDDARVGNVAVTEANGLVTVRYAHPTLLTSESAHTFELVFQDDATPPNVTTNRTRFTIAKLIEIALPAPVHLENFDSTAEGQLPAGWTGVSFTDVSSSSPDVDFENLDSAVYAAWTTVNVDRFQGTFVHAGTDSWYWGVDNFGLYSLASPPAEPATPTAVAQSGSIALTWTGGQSPFQVQKTDNLANSTWQNVGGPTNERQFTDPIGGSAAFYRVIGQ